MNTAAVPLLPQLQHGTALASVGALILSCYLRRHVPRRGSKVLVRGRRLIRPGPDCGRRSWETPMFLRGMLCAVECGFYANLNAVSSVDRCHLGLTPGCPSASAKPSRQ